VVRRYTGLTIKGADFSCIRFTHLWAAAEKPFLTSLDCVRFSGFLSECEILPPPKSPIVTDGRQNGRCGLAGRRRICYPCPVYE
jgi:hypothetical protein